MMITMILVGEAVEQAGRGAASAGSPLPAVSGAASARGTAAPAGLLPGGPAEHEYPRLHNLLRVSDRIYSGSQPDDEQAFADLVRLGIRTVVSVDGARPDTAAARRHGLRYVHIPIGYDGVSQHAGRSLARLVREAEGPFYIHCHHGKHRGPAAAAVACIADRIADGRAAATVLAEAGTSEKYAGLWRDVRSYLPPSADELLPELVEVAEVGSLVAAMAQIDRAADHLKLCQSVLWRSPADHPDVAAAQQALLLKEGYRETVRHLEADNAYGERFLTWMRQAESTAADLQSALEQGDTAAATTHFATAQTDCTRCHDHYRD